MYGYDGLPMLPVAPPSPDYVPSPEEPQTPPALQDEDKHEPMFIQPHDPDFMPEPIYPEYIPLEDERVLPTEEQPLPPVVLPTAESLEDDDDGNLSGDDADDKDEDEEEEEDEEEHLALADSAIVIPTDELVSLLEGTEPVIPPPSTGTATTGARITIRIQATISFPPEAEVERLLAMPTPSPSPLTSLSPPLQGSTWLGSRYEVGESSTARPTGGQGIDYGFVSTLDVEARRQGIREVGYGIRETSIDLIETVPKIAHMTVGEVNTRVTELVELHEYDTQDLYAILEDAQDSRTHISQRVKFATCTLLDAALTWWNSQIISLGPDAYSMTWEVLKKKMTDKYYSQGEIKKLEIELCNLKVKENNVPAYTEHFQELNLICTKFVADETEKIDKYVSGLPDKIYKSVKASKPKTLDETIELANDLMDQKLGTYSERQKTTKERLMIHSETTMVTNSRPPKGKISLRSTNRDGREEAVQWKFAQVHQVPFLSQWPMYPEVPQVQQGHFKRDSPKVKNKDGGKVNAPGWVYTVENAENRGNASRDPDSNVVTGTFLLNNRYASILFDTGADRSFITIAFTSLIDIVPTLLGNSYDVELANGKLVGLRRCHASIVCDEKLVRIPYGNETLTFRGNESKNGRESRLTVISCSKAQEYMAKGCQIFLAHISAMKEEDRSKGKQIEDVPVVKDVEYVVFTITQEVG
nr:hypothetical protein [Tanacetum cinerariifolium]